MRRPKCTISVSRGADFYVNQCQENQNLALEKAQEAGGQLEKDFSNLVFWAKAMVRFAASRVNKKEEGDGEAASDSPAAGDLDTPPTSFAEKGSSDEEAPESSSTPST